MSQFDEYAQTYESGLKELLGTQDTKKFIEYKIQLIEQLSKIKNGKILDFGCGIGRSFPFLLKYFPQAELYGCDVSEKSIKYAAEYISSENLFLNQTFESMSSKGSMDIVFASCVFHHIPPEERKGWIKAIIEILSKNGLFFIFEHNTKNPITKKIILDPKNIVDDINWMITKKELTDIICSLPNTKIVWSGYTLFSPIRPYFMTNLERFLKWLPIGAQYCVVAKKQT